MTIDSATAETVMTRLKEEVAKPNKFRSLNQCVEIVKSLSDDSSEVKVNDITMAVMKDLALTTRVLQVANTVKYNQSGQRVNSVSEAIMVLGLGPIRSIAFSVLLVETLPSQLQQSTVRDMCLTAAVGGTVTRLLCERAAVAEPELGYLVGSFIHFGKLLCYSILPDLVRIYEGFLRDGQMGDHEACCRVFGMGFEQIGREMAQHLGLPTSVTLYMDPRDSEQMPAPGQQNLANATGVSFEICRILRSPGTSEELKQQIKELSVRKSEEFIGVDIEELFYEAAHEINSFYQCDASSPLWGKVSKVMESFELGDVVVEEEPKTPLEVLRHGVSESISLLAHPQKGLVQTLEPMCRILCQGLSASATVIATKSGNNFLPTAGYGRNSDVVKRLLTIPLEKDTNDLASIALWSGKDVYIEDIRNLKVSRVIPLWVKMSDPDSFLMMPVVAEDGRLALIYVERPVLTAGGKMDKDIAHEVGLMRNLVALTVRTK